MKSILNWLLKVFPKPRIEDCTKDPGLDAIIAVIKLTAKFASGSVKIGATGGSPVSLLFNYGWLLWDVVQVINKLPDIPCEISMLKSEKYDELVDAVIFEFGINDSHAKVVINSTMDLISSITKVAPSLHGFLSAVHTYNGDDNV